MNGNGTFNFGLGRARHTHTTRWLFSIFFFLYIIYTASCSSVSRAYYICSTERQRLSISRAIPRSRRRSVCCRCAVCVCVYTIAHSHVTGSIFAQSSSCIDTTVCVCRAFAVRYALFSFISFYSFFFCSTIYTPYNNPFIVWDVAVEHRCGSGFSVRAGTICRRWLSAINCFLLGESADAVIALDKT